jgi:DNA-binding MarR family transcriptional regulator
MVDNPGPEQVGLLYLSVAYRLRKVLDEHMAGSGVSLSRAKVLQALKGKAAIRQLALAQELGLAQRSITQAIEGLERDGLVERASDPTDGRAKLVTLTTAGAAALIASTDTGNRVLQGIFGSLDREQLTSLTEMLATLDAATSES